MIEDILFKASIWVIPVLTAITFHEASHGWMASKLGDNTALQANRVTLNPFKHIDPFGTILLPAVLLFVGWNCSCSWALWELRAVFKAAWANEPVPEKFGGLFVP